MALLVFDLDQTLIRGEAVDWPLWVHACEAALGVHVPLDQDWTSYAVHTDHGLLAEVSARFRGLAVDPAERARFEAVYLSGLVAAGSGPFRPVPGAPELLARVRGRAGIATGNMHAATTHKLVASGLARNRLPCSCSEDAHDRPALVRRCLATLGWRSGDRAVSFGDAVWDVRAAREVAIGFVGVAQSDAHEGRLRTAGARIVLRDFTDVGLVDRAIDAAEEPGPQPNDLR